MRLNRIFLSALIIILTACTAPTVENNTGGSSSQSSNSISNNFNPNFIDKDLGYSLVVPDQFAAHGAQTRVSPAGKKTNHSFWNGHFEDGKDMYIDIFNNEPSCNEEIIGISKTEDLFSEDTEATWGKVTFTGYDYPPNFIKCTSIFGDNAAAYALCSQKNEKTVIICISQATDNPTLAKEIFETFRWTE
jgi:hypothetical protein